MKPEIKAPAISIREVVSIAREAGDAIMEQLTAGMQVTTKDNETPVTAADKAADAIIKRRLQALTPGIPILSEESAPEEKATAQAASMKWVIDPLDGTKTAIRYANGDKEENQFGVHIALVKDGTPVRGVAYFPAMNEGKGVAYFTGDGGRAYKQMGDDAPKVIHASKPPLKEDGLRLATHFNVMRQPDDIAGRPYVAVPGVGGQRVCLVAEGAADIADMYNIKSDKLAHGYSQWDLAAGHAILKAAGGELVSVHTKKPLAYDRADHEVDAAYAGGRETLNMLQLAEPSLSPPARKR